MNDPYSAPYGKIYLSNIKKELEALSNTNK